MSAALRDQSIAAPMPRWPFDLPEPARLARAALANYVVDVRTVERVPGGYNAVFAVRSAAGDRYALRLHVPGARTADEVGLEMAWLAALAAETEVGAPEPLVSREGDLLNTVTGLGGESLNATVVSWLPGGPFADAVTPGQVERAGEMLTRLHLHAETWDRDGTVGLRLDVVWPFGAPSWLLDPMLAGPLDDAARATIAGTAARVGVEVAALYAGPNCPARSMPMPTWESHGGRGPGPAAGLRRLLPGLSGPGPRRDPLVAGAPCGGHRRIGGGGEGMPAAGVPPGSALAVRRRGADRAIRGVPAGGGVRILADARPRAAPSRSPGPGWSRRGVVAAVARRRGP